MHGNSNGITTCAGCSVESRSPEARPMQAKYKMDPANGGVSEEASPQPNQGRTIFHRNMSMT